MPMKVYSSNLLISKKIFKIADFLKEYKVTFFVMENKKFSDAKLFIFCGINRKPIQESCRNLQIEIFV